MMHTIGLVKKKAGEREGFSREEAEGAAINTEKTNDMGRRVQMYLL